MSLTARVPLKTNRILTAAAVLTPIFLLGAAPLSPAHAQPEGGEQAPDYVDALRQCQEITEDPERLACFDNAVTSIVTASDSGEVRVIDREEVRATRRSLFGFSVPDVALLEAEEGEEEDELFETTITSVRYSGRNQIRFTTAEGAVWEMNNVPRRLRRVNEGDTVIFKEASLGFYFVRIEGQTGIKGRRIR